MFWIFLVRFGWFGWYALAGFRKTSSPVSPYIGRVIGSTRNSSRMVCRDDSTSQSTNRAFCTAMMQTWCQCLTEVFSLWWWWTRQQSVSRALPFRLPPPQGLWPVQFLPGLPFSCGGQKNVTTFCKGVWCQRRGHSTVKMCFCSTKQVQYRSKVSWQSVESPFSTRLAILDSYANQELRTSHRESSLAGQKTQDSLITDLSII